MSRDTVQPTHRLAIFATELESKAIPAEVTRAATRGVTDLLGVMLAGTVQPELRPLVAYARSTYGAGRATALALDFPVTAEAAAFTNGAAAHVLDFDDCGDAIGGHPTVPVLPAVLALAEETGAEAAEALAAYVVGVEVENALGLSLNYRHYERGWHPTATLGIFGAAAAASRLLGADTGTSAQALAIATSMSSGIKGNFGTLMKAGQVGFATAKGVAAARLAGAGVTANLDVFRGSHSFPAVFNGDDRTDWSALDDLGLRWTMTSPGLVFKLHPCCGSMHGAIDAVLALRSDGEIDPHSIERIDVYLHPRRLPHIDRPHPATGLAGKFSVQYVTAAAALRGALTLRDFDDDRLKADDIRRLLPQVHVHPLADDEQVLGGRIDCFASRVEVVDAAGMHRRSVVLPRGSDPSVPLTDSELGAKFVENAALAMGRDAAPQALEKVRTWCAGDGSLCELMSFLHSKVLR